MNSSGIKRGLAATAIAALAVTGIPALAGTAHAAVGSVTVTSLSSYDFDEFTDLTRDIVVTVKETNNTPTIGQAVEFSYVFTPEGGAAQPATAYALGGVTDANGTADLAFDPVLAGSYTVTVRTVGSHISAPAFTFVAGEAEITWADGVSARSPQNGSDTYAGTLALTNAAATPLSGRKVEIDYDSAGNVIMSTPQPPGTDRVNDDEATATTAANGGFSVGLTDPPAPVGTDSGTLEADTAFTGQADLAVTFEPTPVVKAVTLTTKDVFGAGNVAPGKPVELNVKVTSEGPTPAPDDDIVLKDYPVSVVVDKGFLTPDTQGEGLNVDPTELDLTADQDDEGDLFGFYENLGADETVETSDDAGDPANNAAGVVATIEKDAGFNDDGLVDQKVTVTAGGKTATATISYDSRKHLNLTAAAFRRDGGSPRVPGAIDLKLYAVDQYVNLVGDQGAKLSDDTPIARVVGESSGSSATTDFVNDNPSARASSSQPVKQTITGAVTADEAVVDKNGNPDFGADSAVVKATHVINWVKATAGGKSAITATLSGADNGPEADKLKVKAPAKAAGAVVKLFKIVGGKAVPAGTKTLGANGRVTFVKKDKNGDDYTKYFAKVLPTSDTKGDRTNNHKVR